MSNWRDRDGMLLQRNEWRERVRQPVGRVRAGLSDAEARAGRTYDGRPALVSGSSAATPIVYTQLSTTGSNSTVGWSATAYTTTIWYNSADHAIVWPYNRAYVELLAWAFTAGYYDAKPTSATAEPSLTIDLQWIDSSGAAVGSVSTICVAYIQKSDWSPQSCLSICGMQTPTTAISVPATATGVRLRTVAQNAATVNTSYITWDATFGLALKAA
jgi:hypothetical protein